MTKKELLKADGDVGDLLIRFKELSTYEDKDLKDIPKMLIRISDKIHKYIIKD